MEGAQAKALYGLALNYKPLHALVDRLLHVSTLTGEEVAEVLDGAGLVPFPDPFVEGFTWDENGRLVYPGIEDQVLLLFSSPTRVHASLLLSLLVVNCVQVVQTFFAPVLTSSMLLWHGYASLLRPINNEREHKQRQIMHVYPWDLHERFLARNNVTKQPASWRHRKLCAAWLAPPFI